MMSQTALTVSPRLRAMVAKATAPATHTNAQTLQCNGERCTVPSLVAMAVASLAACLLPPCFGSHQAPPATLLLSTSGLVSDRQLTMPQAADEKPAQALSATTMDHQGPWLKPSTASQYQAETSGHDPPRASRMSSQTARSPSRPCAWKHPIKRPSASRRTGRGTIA